MTERDSVCRTMLTAFGMIFARHCVQLKLYTVLLYHMVHILTDMTDLQYFIDPLQSPFSLR
uniref:Uncharacterized protein n=1 Tax=Anguilla anguilla TaxID=7936 RepID=A0A0E9XJT9_ANGAN